MRKSVFFFGFFGALFGCENTPTVINTNRGQIEFQLNDVVLTSVFDFGKLKVSATKQQSLQIKNVGKDAMNISRLYFLSGTSGSFFVSNQPTQVLLPAESLTRTLTFAPSQVGSQSAQVLVEHDANSATPKLELVGEGI